MNPANYNFYLSAFKETNHPQLWGLVFPGDKDITLGFVTLPTSVLPLTISYLPPRIFLLFYFVAESRDDGSIPFIWVPHRTYRPGAGTTSSSHKVCRTGSVLKFDFTTEELQFRKPRQVWSKKRMSNLSPTSGNTSECTWNELERWFWRVSPHPTPQLCFLILLLLPPLQDPFPEKELMDYDSFSGCYY